MQMRVGWAEGTWQGGRMLDAVGGGSQHREFRGGVLIVKEQMLTQESN